MIKICDKSILKPLIILFENSMKSSYYTDIWKKSNIIPVHKKNDKQLVNNYRPISLSPIFGNIFEEIVFNRIYNFLADENILNFDQSGFRPSDSCVNQLLSITHEIFEAFDCNLTLEVRSVFLDISKAFDKVWHEGLLYKLKSMGISGELFKLLESYLPGRFQRVVSIRNSESIAIFKSRLLSFIRPSQNNVYNIFDPSSLKLLARLRLGFSHLNEHKFRHNFQDCSNPLCLCSLEIENTSHYLLHCQYYSEHRINLINSLKSISDDFESFSDNVQRDILLYGDSRFDTNKNKLILEATVSYIKNTDRFAGSRFG